MGDIDANNFNANIIGIKRIAQLLTNFLHHIHDSLIILRFKIPNKFNLFLRNH